MMSSWLSVPRWGWKDAHCARPQRDQVAAALGIGQLHWLARHQRPLPRLGHARLCPGGGVVDVACRQRAVELGREPGQPRVEIGPRQRPAARIADREAAALPLERLDDGSDKLADLCPPWRIPREVGGPVPVPLPQVLPREGVLKPPALERSGQTPTAILVFPLTSSIRGPPVATAVRSAACRSSSSISVSRLVRSGSGSPPKGSGYMASILGDPARCPTQAPV